jgi:D-hydroxyproline dehydrogenase subunit alpha
VRSVRFDILIVGAGPAGIAAACAACEGGGSVGIVDAGTAAGGQIWRGSTSRWVKRLADSRAEFLPRTQVLDAPGAGTLLAESDGEALELSFSRLILATGARELFLPFPGWTLPNVMGAGGLQALVKGGLPVAGRRVIVAGTGPLLLAVAEFLRKRGALVPLIAEQAPWRRIARFGWSLLRHPAKLAQALKMGMGSPRYLTSCWALRAEGDGKVEAVTLRCEDRTWSEPCDYLACAFGLTPNTELARLLGCGLDGGFVTVNKWQQTSIINVYCAGEPVGIGGLDLALVSGEIAGYSAAGLRTKAAALFRERERTLRFRTELATAFALRDELKQLPAADTIVCRCEDVVFARLTAYRESRAAKLQTRCGMGPCQGRICGPACEFLLGWPTAPVRPPIFPATVDCLRGAQMAAVEGKIDSKGP